jgi:GNAT superfamily N-acetyltransferase
MPLRFFRLKTLAAANVIGVLWSGAMFAWFFLSALYMQRVLGYTPMQVGLAFLPGNLIMAVCSLGISAWVVNRYGLRRPLVGGLACAALGLALFARAPVDGGFVVDVLPGMMLSGLGAGIAFNPLLLAAMSGVDQRESGLASGIVNTSFMMGGAVGLAVPGQPGSGAGRAGRCGRRGRDGGREPRLPVRLRRRRGVRVDRRCPGCLAGARPAVAGSRPRRRSRAGRCFGRRVSCMLLACDGSDGPAWRHEMSVNDVAKPLPTVRRLERVTKPRCAAWSELLIDCVAGGASVSFMHPLSAAKATAFWTRVADDVAAGGRALFVADDERAIVGTVQLVLDLPENQPHRADVSKMLVHRRARRRGLGAALMRRGREPCTRAQPLLACARYRQPGGGAPVRAAGLAVVRDDPALRPHADRRALRDQVLLSRPGTGLRDGV